MWLSRMMNVGRSFVCWKTSQAPLDAIEIVGIADAQHVPAVGQEPRGDVLGEGDVGLALDGDVVVVVDPAEVVEARDGRPATPPPSATPSIRQPSPQTA